MADTPTTRVRKTAVRKSETTVVGTNADWRVVRGELERANPKPGRPPKETERLFVAIGEKIPFEFLSAIGKRLKEEGVEIYGVYIAHDSMGYPRYVGRGNIVSRLEARRKAQILELRYFSFFIVKDKKHEREIETIMIRAAGPLLDFNQKKVRIDISAGSVLDFEAGTRFFERQYRKGKKPKPKT